MNLRERLIRLAYEDLQQRQAGCDCEHQGVVTKSPAERSKDLGHWTPTVEHGYGEPISGGFDIMKRLQDQLRIEQGRPPRPKNPRLAKEDEDEPKGSQPLRLRRDYGSKDAAGLQQSELQEWLTQLLSLLRAQHWVYWTAHWQVSGDPFYGDHLLFQRMYEGLAPEIDTLAEKVVGYLGTSPVDAEYQMQKTHSWVTRWFAIKCPYRRGIQAEKDLQEVARLAYEKLKAGGTLTLGLDDYIMSLASAHETNQYLLQQRTSGKNSATRLASEWERLSSGAPSAEDMFAAYSTNSWVRDFAQSGAISNEADVAVTAVAEGEMDVSVATEVAKAESGPPTPNDLIAEPGGDELSSLAAAIVTTEERAPGAPDDWAEVEKAKKLAVRAVMQRRRR